MESPIAQPESPYEILRRLENIVRVGTIAAMRYGRPARCRVRTGNLTTNWVRWIAGSAGGRERSKWCPPVVGEQCLLIAPGGDLLNAMALVGIYSDAMPQRSESATACRTDWSPSEFYEHDSATGQLTAMVENGITLRVRDGASIEMTRERIVLRAGGGSLVIDAQGVSGAPDVVSGGISLRRHRHGGVERGGALTEGPL